MLKKVNAVLALASAVFALLHIAVMCPVLCGMTDFLPVFSVIGKALLRLFILHIAISLCIMFFCCGNGFRYPKLNKSTVLQRVSALLLLLVIHFHMGNYFTAQGFVPPSVFGYVTELIFALLVLCHFMSSVDKGLLTLGVCGKVSCLIVRIVFLLAFLLSAGSVSVYFLGALA